MEVLKHIFILTLLIIAPIFSSPAIATESPLAEGSLYELSPHLTDQDGKQVGMDVFQGHPVVVSMFYASCNYTCPILIDSLKNLDAKLDPKIRDQVRVLLISFDPENDTPAILKKLAIDGKVDLKRWKFVSPASNEVRDIAAVLNFTYRELPNGGFNHTSSLTLLDDTGKPIAQEEGTIQAAENMIPHIMKLVGTWAVPKL